MEYVRYVIEIMSLNRYKQILGSFQIVYGIFRVIIYFKLKFKQETSFSWIYHCQFL